jgi:hypothetical protein
VRTGVPRAIRGTRRGSRGRVTPVLGTSPAWGDGPAVVPSGIVHRLSHGSRGGLRVPRRVQTPDEGGTRLAYGLGPESTTTRLQ